MTHTTIDAILCVLWTVTYTLALIGTGKYKYPIIPPITQLIIASLEFSVLFQLVKDGIFWENHVFTSYLLWTILEIAIIVSQIRQGFVRKQHVILYLALIAGITFMLCYWVAYREQQLFFTLFNTLLGEIIWLIQIRKKDYPMKPMVLAMFLAKFVADVMSVPVYFGRGSWVESLMGVLIPTVDFLFIHVYFQRIAETEESISRCK